MKYLKQFLLVMLLVAGESSTAGSFGSPSYADGASIGLGAGMDYGGIGGSILVYPGNNNLGLFFGIGYAAASIGMNGGIKYRFLSERKFVKVTPYLQAMYGYNAAFVVTNAVDYNKLFYGVTLGAGIDLRKKANSAGYWSFGLLLPIRSSEVAAYTDELETNHGVEFENELLPVAFSVGYRFIIQ